MHPLSRASSSAAATSVSGLYPGQDQPLTTAESARLSHQIRDTVTRARSLLDLLRSSDPGVDFPPNQRDSMINRCRQAVDTSYVSDVQPSLNLETSRQADLDAPPAFNAHHKSIADLKAGHVRQLIDTISRHAQAKLDKSCQMIRENLQEVQDELRQLNVPCKPPCEVRTMALLKSFSARAELPELERCRIAKPIEAVQAQALNLYQHRQALRSLNELSVGPLDGPAFSMHDHPTYHQLWRSSVQAVEKEDWQTVRSTIGALAQARTKILSAAG